jgi:hypothetical protein
MNDIHEHTNNQVTETPTEKQLVSACFSYRHDFGLMIKEEAQALLREARHWWGAIAKEINNPSGHPMVNDYVVESQNENAESVIDGIVAGYYVVQLFGTSDMSIVYSDGRHCFVAGSNTPLPTNVVNAISINPLDLTTGFGPYKYLSDLD